MKHFSEPKIQLYSTTPDAKKWTAVISLDNHFTRTVDEPDVITQHGGSPAEALLNLAIVLRTKELCVELSALIPGHSGPLSVHPLVRFEDSVAALPAQALPLAASAANARQVGGSHYRELNVIQHWDFAALHQFDYFQGQVTKYVTRWKMKNGLEDLKKALHFLEKYIEVWAEFAPCTCAETDGKKCMIPLHQPAK